MPRFIFRQLLLSASFICYRYILFVVGKPYLNKPFFFKERRIHGDYVILKKTLVTSINTTGNTELIARDETGIITFLCFVGAIRHL